MKSSTLVTVKGHLLAVGRSAAVGYRGSRDIYQYNPEEKSWQFVCQMKAERCDCAVALLSGNKLMVVGGTFEEPQVELASISLIESNQT